VLKSKLRALPETFPTSGVCRSTAVTDVNAIVQTQKQSTARARPTIPSRSGVNSSCACRVFLEEHSVTLPGGIQARRDQEQCFRADGDSSRTACVHRTHPLQAAAWQQPRSHHLPHPAAAEFSVITSTTRVLSAQAGRKESPRRSFRARGGIPRPDLYRVTGNAQFSGPTAQAVAYTECKAAQPEFAGLTWR
jgi:hypothetical protein